VQDAGLPDAAPTIEAAETALLELGDSALGRRYPASVKVFSGAWERFIARSRLLVPVDTIVTQVNAFLRGWVAAGSGISVTATRPVFDKMQSCALHRLAIFIGNRHKRTAPWGWRVVAYASTRPLRAASRPPRGSHRR